MALIHAKIFKTIENSKKRAKNGTFYESFWAEGFPLAQE
jgi:hypothetical protein